MSNNKPLEQFSKSKIDMYHSCMGYLNKPLDRAVNYNEIMGLLKLTLLRDNYINNEGLYDILSREGISAETLDSLHVDTMASIYADIASGRQAIDVLKVLIDQATK